VPPNDNTGHRTQSHTPLYITRPSQAPPKSTSSNPPDHPRASTTRPPPTHPDINPLEAGRSSRLGHDAQLPHSPRTASPRPTTRNTRQPQNRFGCRSRRRLALVHYRTTWFPTPRTYTAAKPTHPPRTVLGLSPYSGARALPPPPQRQPQPQPHSQQQQQQQQPHQPPCHSFGPYNNFFPCSHNDDFFLFLSDPRSINPTTRDYKLAPLFHLSSKPQPQYPR
jgi:hypothetical protein